MKKPSKMPMKKKDMDKEMPPWMRKGMDDEKKKPAPAKKRKK